MTPVLKCLAVILCIGAISFQAHAQRERDESCKADAAKLCPGMERGDGLGKCLREKKAQVSAACKASMDKREERRKAIQTACKADIAKLCPDAKEGERGPRGCLKKNEAKLSAGCKKVIGD